MGTNSKTSHQSYLVAPTLGSSLDPTVDPTVDVVEPQVPQPEGHPIDEPVAPDTLSSTADATLETVPSCHVLHLLANGQLPSLDDVNARYTALVAATEAARDELDQADLDDDAKAALRAQIKADTVHFLSSLTPEQLQLLATNQGFAYAGLVGLSGSSQHPLVHWLDPAYPADCESKKKIQLAAYVRFDTLCAGQSVAGKTLAEWKALNPTLSAAAAPSLPPGVSPWVASPADIQQVQHRIATRLDELTYPFAGITDKNAALVDLIAAENELASAQCSQLGSALPEAVAATRHKIHDVLATVDSSTAGPAIHAAVQDGRINPEYLTVLGHKDLLQLARASTPSPWRDALHGTADHRLKTLTTFTTAHKAVQETLTDGQLMLAPADTFAGQKAALSYLHHAQNVISSSNSIKEWAEHAFDESAAAALAHDPESVTLAFTGWASTQQLPGLRTIAAGAGAGDTAGLATTGKGDLLAFFHHKMHGHHTTPVAPHEQPATKLTPTTPNHHGAGSSADPLPAVKKAVAKPLGTKPQAASSPQVPAATAEAATTAGSTNPSPTVHPTSIFLAQHAHLVSALHHVKASHSAIPERLEPATVQGWSFGDGTPAALGGAHPKTVHTGPDGGKWLAKPESHPCGGALAAAEATASDVLARVGLPSIPVYATTIGGKHASVQPLLSGLTPFSSAPHSWSQSDVDALVRLHVASWALSDHDAHNENILRTPGAGLVSVDRGQAWKYFGRDTLSNDYHPNSSYGAPPPAYQALYNAHLTGGLAAGVHLNVAAAHPVIRRFERIPDAEYRAMLHRVAHLGAAHGNVEWVTPMRTRAAATHGTQESAVNASQIAEAFLDHAVERKQRLRADFVTFFAGDLKISSAAAALGHAG